MRDAGEKGLAPDAKLISELHKILFQSALEKTGNFRDSNVESEKTLFTSKHAHWSDIESKLNANAATHSDLLAIGEKDKLRKPIERQVLAKIADYHVTFMEILPFNDFSKFSVMNRIVASVITEFQMETCLKPALENVVIEAFDYVHLSGWPQHEQRVEKFGLLLQPSVDPDNVVSNDEFQRKRNEKARTKDQGHEH